MQTVSIQIFKFNELSADAQQVAINGLGHINTDHNWWEFTYEDAKEIGLQIKGFDLDRNRGADGRFIGTALNCAQNIIANHGTECATFTTAKSFIEEWNGLVNKWTGKIDGITPDGNNYYITFESDANEYDFDLDLQDLEDDFLQSILEDYSIMLQNECDYLQSDEAIKETIIANDYDFLITGKQY